MSERPVSLLEGAATEPWREPPMGMLCELTHRCPLQCPYCSNPIELEKAAGELTTEEWCRTLTQADELGVRRHPVDGRVPLDVQVAAVSRPHVSRAGGANGPGAAGGGRARA